MYSSLDRVDIVIEEEGRSIGLQTDHRDAGEVEGDWARSVLFATARARNPVQGKLVDRVRFVLMGTTSPRFVALLRALGAEVEIQGERQAPAPDPALVDQEVRAAAALLARQVLDGLDAQATAEELERVEAMVHRDTRHARPDDESQVDYWSGIVDLGAVTAAVIQGLHGGELVADTEVVAAIPYRLRVGETLVGVFGRAEEFIDRDPEWKPSQLLRALADRAAPDGDVMFSLRPPDWAAANLALQIPFLSATEDPVPRLALVVDRPETTRTFPADADPAPLQVKAEANIARVRVASEEIQLGPALVLAFAGHYYAAEKLLDTAHMRAVQERLGAEMVFAATPRRGLLLVAAAVPDPQRTATFAELARRQHDQAPVNERISPVVLLVRDGEIVGLARVSRSQKPGIWGKIFGR